MRIERDGVGLDFEIVGDSGPTILLAHGLGGSRHQWRGVVSRMSPVGRLILPDLRGHGASDKPSGGYTLRGFADDLAAVCRAAGAERVVAVGASFAGAVVLQMTAAHPDLVRGVVSVGGFASMGPAGRERMERRAAAVEERGMEGVADDVVAAALGPTSHALRPALVGLVRAGLLANDRRAYAACARMVATADVTADLPRVKVPVMLVFGTEEKVAPLPVQMELRRSLPHAVLRAIPRAGHLPFLEEPEAFTAALMEFVGGLS